MLPNLDEEQARNRITDRKIAELLSISREIYVRKKKSENFKSSEIKKLCALFQCQFEYLFDSADQQ